MDIDKIFHFLEYVGTITESGEVVVSVFFELAIAIIIEFLLRIILIFRSANIHFFKEEKYLKQKAIILNHIGLEIIITFIFSFLFLLIINMVFAPLLGQIVAICIDDWYLIPKEKESIFNKIEINKSVATGNTIKDLINIHEMIDESIINSSDFQPVIVKHINEIKRVQNEHKEKIDLVAEKCDTSLELLQKLKRAGMNDKRIALKESIYDCLNNGFVTPKERDKIVADYESYINEYDGNGEIKSLYENHFVKLSVHEDRRKKNIDVKNDRRKERRVPYGTYDKKEKN